MASGNAFDDKTTGRIERALRWVERAMRARIPGGSNSPTEGPTFPDLRVVRSPRVARTNDQFLWVRILGHTQPDPTIPQWIYDWREQIKTSSGYGGWTDGDRFGHGDDWGYLYNGLEDQNAATGMTGGGVTIPIATGDFELKPFPDDAIVLARIVNPQDGGKPELWPVIPNGIDGDCGV
jgi:hypothetical protein